LLSAESTTRRQQARSPTTRRSEMDEDSQPGAGRTNPSDDLQGRGGGPKAERVKVENERGCTDSHCYCRGKPTDDEPNSDCKCAKADDTTCFHGNETLGCEVNGMTCDDPIECQGKENDFDAAVYELYICRYKDAASGNVELHVINYKCDPIVCRPPPKPTTPGALTKKPKPTTKRIPPTAKSQEESGLYELPVSLCVIDAFVL